MPGTEIRRNEKGHFLPGNKAGPGRPPRMTEEKYLEVTFSNCTLDDWEQIVRKAVSQAKRGSHKAREWLSKHLLPSSSALHSQVIDLGFAVPMPNEDDIESALNQRIELLVNAHKSHVIEVEPLSSQSHCQTEVNSRNQSEDG